MVPSVYVPEQWKPLDPPLKNRAGERSEEALRGVLAQFDVVGNPRYQPEPDGRTWCNVYVRDACKALGCPLPVKLPTEVCAALGYHEGPLETRANHLCRWLASEFGKAAGWAEVDETVAGAAAARGWPVVACWENPKPGSSGHVVMLLPPHGHELRVAGAGRSCVFDASLAKAFGRYPVRFFSHP